MRSPSFNEIFSSFADTLARRFPIACASDEFYYFPQVKIKNPDWRKWDDFSIETVMDTVTRLKKWEVSLDRLSPQSVDFTADIDCRLLTKIIRTLKEQLESVRTWQTQPTSYLIIACVGMTEALLKKDPWAARERAIGLPEFFKMAGGSLAHVPRLFRNLALEMIPDIRRYFGLLCRNIPEMKKALSALDRFETALKELHVSDTFHLSKEWVGEVFKSHINTGMDPDEIETALEEEIDGMQQVLLSTAAKISPHPLWKEAIKQIPLPQVDQSGLIGLYRQQVHELVHHCVDAGIVPAALAKQCPANVEPVPEFLSATRTASSYSIKPQYPPTGGTFYVFNAADPEEARQPYQREYRLLAAHETWPGHHLLDVCRWGLERPVRRVVEQPIYYEGWACFSEELMHRTGYFPSDYDRLQLARRRLWRAIRGKLDLKLQTGAMDIETAARYLSQTGIEISRARATVRKYALNPGYQLCYTIGLRYLLDLFTNFGRNRPQWFAKTVLAQGEIGFNDLREVLKNKTAEEALKQ